MFLRRHVLKQPGDLEGTDEAALHPLAGTEAGHVLTGDAYCAGRGLEVAGDEIDESGLAGAIGADQHCAVSRRKRQRDIIGDDEAAEILLQAGDFENGAHLRPPRRRVMICSPAP
ncbi:hypothetical protein D3C72_1225990 [compost metagenome]